MKSHASKIRTVGTKKTRGQTGMEYLMTYGWAILVIVVVALVLWQMGIFEIGKTTEPGKRGFSQIRPLDWRLTTGGNLEITLLNDAGMILNLTQVSAEITSGGGGLPCVISGGTGTLSVFRPAQSHQVQFTTCPVTDDVGSYFRIEVEIQYINPSSGLQHTSYGEIWGGIE